MSNARCIKRLLYEITRVVSIISCRLYTLVILIEWVKRKRAQK
nr:MAG TPA: Melittin [Caudoviricetes sp.]